MTIEHLKLDKEIVGNSFQNLFQDSAFSFFLIFSDFNADGVLRLVTVLLDWKKLGFGKELMGAT